jgi:ABC-2 type transport system ATP-binding protein
MDRLLEVDGISKQFGRITAVDDISFSVQRGEVLGFLGPNGAGKSTTMRIITGFLPPSAGRVTVCGYDVLRQPIEVKRRIGYLPEGAPAYGDMSPLGLLGFVADLRGLKGARRRERLSAVVERLQLEGVLNQPIETLSKGFKRRVGLAQAILADPEVLILDEPTDGLDPNQKHEVRLLLEEMAGDKAIIISTHILEEVEAVCSRAMVVARGRIVADDAPAKLQARSRYHNAVGIRVVPEKAEALRSALAELPGVESVEAGKQLNGHDLDHGASEPASDGWASLRAIPRDGQEILAAVQEAAKKKRIPLGQVFVEQGRLDDVFRQLTGAQ